MSQSLECPHCHTRTETRAAGWRRRSCRVCAVPLVLAAAPTEALVRKYLYGDRLADIARRPSS